MFQQVITWINGLFTGAIAASLVLFFYGFNMKLLCFGDKCTAMWWW